MRYDEVFAALVERALGEAVIDLRTFVRQAQAAGISEKRLLEMIDEDIETDGRVFGKFFRGLTGAATASAAAAQRQGELIGAIDGDAELQRLTRLAGIEGSVIEALDNADPAAADAIEREVLDQQDYTWICALRNTCHLCLPLHGKTQRLAEWKSAGLSPDTIHPEEWGSSCYCRLVLAAHAASRKELVAPLRRVKVEGQGSGAKAARRTKRAMTAADIEAAIKARDAATQSIEGRRVLRLLGESGDEA